MSSDPAHLTDADVRERIAAVPAWYHPIEIRPGIVTPGPNDAPAVLGLLDLPVDCRGLRVLDLGTRDGFFAFELERRGADVLAVDYMAKEQSGFAVAAQLLGSRVVYEPRNLYALTAAEFGVFDIVLFLGLLYHLPDPLGALRIVRSLTRQRMYVETVVLDFGPGTDDVPLMRFLSGTTWSEDPTNYWAPNARCIGQMLTQTEFAVSRSHRFGDRGLFVCEAISNPASAYYLSVATGQLTPGNDR